MSKAQSETQSPLKERPLRLAGQSVDHEILRLTVDKLMFWGFMVGMFIAVAFLEWYRWLLNATPHPYLMSGFALVAIGFSICRIWKLRPEFMALGLGREGERVVGQYLDDLRQKGYKVFHDLVGDGFNVDHVLVTPHGVFTVETKTRSKPTGREARVCVRDGQVLADGHRLDRNPIEQAKAQAKWLRELIGESTGKHYDVRPVVVFPGWFVERVPKSEDRTVWVLNPKALPSFIEQEPTSLAPSEIALISHHLTLHIRAREDEWL